MPINHTQHLMKVDDSRVKILRRWLTTSVGSSPGPGLLMMMVRMTARLATTSGRPMSASLLSFSQTQTRPIQTGWQGRTSSESNRKQKKPVLFISSVSCRGVAMQTTELSAPVRRSLAKSVWNTPKCLSMDQNWRLWFLKKFQEWNFCLLFFLLWFRSK